jgi:hypothetical protein
MRQRDASFDRKLETHQSCRGDQQLVALHGYSPKQRGLIVEQRNRGQSHRGQEHGEGDEANHRTIHHINCSSKSWSQM